MAIGASLGNTDPTKIGHTKCNVLIDTGTTRSCMGKAYYHTFTVPKTYKIPLILWIDFLKQHKIGASWSDKIYPAQK